MDEIQPTMEEQMMNAMRDQHGDDIRRAASRIQREAPRIVSERYNVTCPEGCPEIPRRFQVEETKTGEITVKPVCRFRTNPAFKKRGAVASPGAVASCGRAIAAEPKTLTQQLDDLVRLASKNQEDYNQRKAQLEFMPGKKITEEYGFECPSPCGTTPSGVRWQGDHIRPICNPKHAAPMESPSNKYEAIRPSWDSSTDIGDSTSTSYDPDEELLVKELRGGPVQILNDH